MANMKLWLTEKGKYVISHGIAGAAFLTGENFPVLIKEKAEIVFNPRIISKKELKNLNGS